MFNKVNLLLMRSNALNQCALFSISYNLLLCDGAKAAKKSLYKMSCVDNEPFFFVEQLNELTLRQLHQQQKGKIVLL